jgi:AsmA family protein
VPDATPQPGPQARRRAPRWVIASGAVLLAIVLLAVFWDWNWFRPLVAARASAALGRTVSLQHFDLHPGRQIVAVADGVEIANPQGFPADSRFATIVRLTVTIDAMAWLRTRQLVIPAIVVDQPRIDAQQPEGGPANWVFAALAPAPGSAPADTQAGPKIGDLQINDGAAHVAVPHLRADFDMTMATTDRAAGGERQIRVEAHGTYAGQPITGEALGGALLSLRDATKPYPIELSLANGPTRVHLTGTVQDPLAFAGADLALELSGTDMALLFPLTGIPIPKTPSYRIAGKLDYGEGNIRFRDFNGKVGSSDLSGDILVDPRPRRPVVTASLQSRLVDLADLGGFIGSEPGRLATPNQTPAQREAVARAEANPKLLPTQKINLPKLRAADVHLKYRGAKILGRNMPFDSFAAVLDIVDGRIRLTPVTLGVGRGQIEGNLDLVPSGDDIRLHGDIGFERLDLGRMLEATGVVHGSGTVGGHAVIDSTGNSVASFLGNGNGSLQLVMSGGGDVSAVIVAISGLQLGNAILAALGVPRRDQIECFLGDFALQRGTLATRTLLLDTSNNIVTGSGTIDLRTESVDYRLKTDAKHFSIGSLPAPIAIVGKFKSPDIGPAVGPLLPRGAAAVGLGVLFPPAALLPTIQFGVGDDGRCAAMAHRTGAVPK